MSIPNLQIAFESVAKKLAAANDLPMETALDLAAYIGDTPWFDDDGQIIALDPDGKEYRLKPWEGME